MLNIKGYRDWRKRDQAVSEKGPGISEKAGCCIMASGMGTRFGSNKLIAELGGRPVVAHVMDTAIEASVDTGTDLVVLTRWDEVAALAAGKGIACIRHSYTAKSDVIRLGITHAESSGWRSCMFMLGDQPLLTPASVKRLYDVYTEFGSNGKVFRLGADGKPGSPVIFSRCHYDALKTLTGEQGGMSLFGPEETVIVPPGGAYEMIDIDTRDELGHVRETLKGILMDTKGR